jgi:hypothetical protein
MGLAWQHGPLAATSIGHLLTAQPLPKRLTFVKPLRRRMRVRFGDEWIVDTDDAASHAAGQHSALPPYAGDLADRVAFAWRAMDAVYEEDERIVGHAADPYHRIDIRSTRP